MAFHRSQGHPRPPKLAGRIPIATLALALVSVTSIAVFLWAVQWNYSIGVNASDTGGNGGNNAAWLWLLGSLAIGVASVTGLIVRMANRPAGHRL